MERRGKRKKSRRGEERYEEERKQLEIRGGDERVRTGGTYSNWRGEIWEGGS